MRPYEIINEGCIIRLGLGVMIDYETPNGQRVGRNRFEASWSVLSEIHHLNVSLVRRAASNIKDE